MKLESKNKSKYRNITAKPKEKWIEGNAKPYANIIDPRLKQKKSNVEVGNRDFFQITICLFYYLKRVAIFFHS